MSPFEGANKNASSSVIDERLCPQITERHSVPITCAGGGDRRLKVSRCCGLGAPGAQRCSSIGVAGGELVGL